MALIEFKKRGRTVRVPDYLIEGYYEEKPDYSTEHHTTLILTTGTNITVDESFMSVGKKVKQARKGRND